jgi:hypothetical protein
MLSLRRLIFLTLISVLFLACGADEEPDPSGTRGFISTEKGKVYFHGDLLILEGSFYNASGLEQIEIVNETLGLDFNLDLERRLVYDLILPHKLPRQEKPEIHEILITLKDVAGGVRIFTYQVDYAFRPEISNMAFTQDPDDPNKRYFKGQVIDPHGIRSLQLNSLRIGNLIYMEFPAGVYNYNLNEAFWFPIVESFGEYPLTLQIINHRGFNLTIIDFEEVSGVGN